MYDVFFERNKKVANFFCQANDQMNEIRSPGISQMAA
jgi:hypothetical protein